MKRTLLLFLLLSALTASKPASADDVVPQVWADYHGHFYLAKYWEFYGDGGARYQWQHPKWVAGYIRPAIRLHSPLGRPVEARGGLGVFYNANEDASNTLEIRPWLGALLKWPRIGFITLSSYVRLEERIVDTIDEESWNAATRFRYRIATKFPLSREARKQYFFIPCSFEWFFNVGQQVENVYPDRMRIDAGLGYIFSYVYTAEFHVMLQTGRYDDTATFAPENLIFRFQIKRLWSAYDYMSQQ